MSLTKEQCFDLLRTELGIIFEADGRLQVRYGANDFYPRMLTTIDALKDSVGDTETHTAWVTVFSAAEGLLGARPAIGIAQEMLRAMADYQVATNVWIHKGLPYYLIWLRCRGEGWDWQMRRFALLTLVEDAIRDFDRTHFVPANSGAYREATRDFALKSTELDQFAVEVHQVLQAYTKEEYWTDLILHELLRASTLARRLAQTPRATSQFEPICPSPQPLLALLEGTTIRHYEAGKALERLTAILFSTIPGAVVREDVHGLFQVDAYADVSSNLELSLQLGPRMIVECKDWAEPANIDTAAKLLATCQTADCKVGIIVSKQGITGADAVKHATRVALQSYLQFGIAILVLDEADLRSVIASGNLAGALVAKLADARLGVF